MKELDSVKNELDENQRVIDEHLKVLADFPNRKSILRTVASLQKRQRFLEAEYSEGFETGLLTELRAALFDELSNLEQHRRGSTHQDDQASDETLPQGEEPDLESREELHRAYCEHIRQAVSLLVQLKS